MESIPIMEGDEGDFMWTLYKSKNSSTNSLILFWFPLGVGNFLIIDHHNHQ